MSKQLGVCLIAKESEEGEFSYLSSIRSFADEIVVVKDDHGAGPSIFYQELDITVIETSINFSLSQAVSSAVAEIQCDWVLILKSDERISSQDCKRLKEFCKNGEAEAHYLIVQESPKSIDLESYEWAGSLGKFSTPKAREKSCMSSLDLRLFKKDLFKNLIIRDNNSILPIFNRQLTDIQLITIRINSSNIKAVDLPEKTEKEKELADYKQFTDPLKEDYYGRDNLQFMGPDYIGYSLLTEKDLPALQAGLDMGFGHVDVIKFMINYFIKKGSYDKALDLADTAIEKIENHIELWRLKGSAYFNKLDLENAAKCYSRALSFDEDDQDILFNLAKVHLISGKFDDAKEILIKLKHGKENLSEIDFLVNSIDNKQDRTVKLSLLMLCRDEEDYIARALESVKDVVDEMVVVDTGSRDRTKSIARNFGAKIVEYPWNDHFGEARNAGLEHITGDYVLWMDADEFIDDNARVALLVFKSVLPLGTRKGVVFNVDTFKEEQDTPNPLPPEMIVKRTAIFPCLHGIRFSGRVFESVDDSLVSLNIQRIFAKNIRFFHISDNADLRKKRMLGALDKCTSELLPPEAVFRCIFYWIDMGNAERAVEWFERVVRDTIKDDKYDKIIWHLANTFAQNGLIDITSTAFKALLKQYRHSYQIMSSCARMLYKAGSYENAAELFWQLFDDEASFGANHVDKKTRLNNIVYLVAAELESDNFEKCDSALRELAHVEDIIDAFQALCFYYEIRKRNIEQGIAILDSWIKTRKLPVEATISSFIDLIAIITQIAEIMMSYGQVDATNILSRSAHYLAESIKVKE